MASITDFGALPAPNDCTHAFQMALNAGGVVTVPYDPAGWNISAPLEIAGNTKLVFETRFTTLRKSGGTDWFILHGSQIEITGGLFDGTNCIGAPLFRLDTSAGNLDDIHIHNMQLRNCGGIIADNGGAGLVTSLWLKDIKSMGTRDTAVWLRRGYAFINFQDIGIDYVQSPAVVNGAAFILENNAGAVLENVHILGHPSAGTAAHGFWFNNCISVRASNCMADTVGGQGWRFQDSDDTYLSNCTASLTRQHGFAYYNTLRPYSRHVAANTNAYSCWLGVGTGNSNVHLNWHGGRLTHNTVNNYWLQAGGTGQRLEAVQVGAAFVNAQGGASVVMG